MTNRIHAAALAALANTAVAPLGFSPRDPYARRIRFAPPDGDGGGTTDPAPPVIKNPDLLKDPAIKAAVEAELAGALAKNAELLDKLNKAKKGGEEISAEELAKLRAIQARVAGDEEVKLFMEGDREAYNARITKKVQQAHLAEVAALKTTVTELETRVGKSETALEGERLDNALSRAAADAGVDPQYTDAVALLIRPRLFIDDGAVRVLDTDNPTQRLAAYGKDGKPMNPVELIEELRKAKPALFIKATGGGAVGGARDAQGRLDMQALGQMPMDQYVALRTKKA